MTETEAQPVDPAELLARGIYDTADPTAIGALFVMADWMVDAIEKNASVDEVVAKLTFVRDYAEHVMDARWRRAES